MPSKGWDKPTGKALRFAAWMSQDLFVIHLGNLNGDDSDEGEERGLGRREWSQEVEHQRTEAGVPPPTLVIAPSPFRDLLCPILEQIDRLEHQFPERHIRWSCRRWSRHTGGRGFSTAPRTPSYLRKAVMMRGDHRIIMVNVPWYL